MVGPGSVAWNIDGRAGALSWIEHQGMCRTAGKTWLTTPKDWALKDDFHTPKRKNKQTFFASDKTQFESLSDEFTVLLICFPSWAAQKHSCDILTASHEVLFQLMMQVSRGSIDIAETYGLESFGFLSDLADDAPVE